jgi:hypothetical protein
MVFHGYHSLVGLKKIPYISISYTRKQRAAMIILNNRQ